MIDNPCSSSNLAGFYRKTEVAFLGEEINFSLMTPGQLDQALIESIELYNKLYPPPPKKGFAKFMNTAIKIGIVAGVGAIAGGAVLAAYGVSPATAMGTISGAAKATAAKGSALATVQKGASAVSAAGMVYGKVTGESPEELMKAAELIKSPSALDAMEFVAKDQLADAGQEIQQGNEAANEALREKLRQEQQTLSDKLKRQAADKASAQGQAPPPGKQSPDLIQVVALATPFILFMLR